MLAARSEGKTAIRANDVIDKRLYVALHESAVDAVDGSSTKTPISWAFSGGDPKIPQSFPWSGFPQGEVQPTSGLL
jgi:hypothetical protein